MKILFCIIGFLFIFNDFSLSAQPLWKQTNGPYDGCLMYITKDARGNLYTITRSKTLYRSTDDGSNWAKLNDHVSAIAFDSHNNCYTGSDTGSIHLYDPDFNFIKTIKDVFYRSYPITSIQVDVNSNIFAISMWQGIELSTNMGEKWEQLMHGSGGDRISLDSGSTMLVTYQGRVKRSTNLGKDWADIQILDTSVKRGVYSIAYNKKFNTFLASSDDKYVYVSNDAGLSWTRSKDSIPGNLDYLWHSDLTGDLFIDDNGYSYLYYETTVCKSIDGGFSWVRLDPFTPFRNYSIVKNKNYLFSATFDKGLVRYDLDNQTIQRNNHGIINSGVYGLEITGAGNLYCSTGYEIFRTTDKGDYWQQLSLPDSLQNQRNYLFCTRSGDIYLKNQNGSFESKDEGLTWKKFRINDQDVFIYAIAESDNGRIYYGSDILYYTDDNGISFKSIELMGKTIVSIATFQNKYVLVGTSREGIFFSDDEGATFTRLPLYVVENYGANVAINQNGDMFINLNGFNGSDATYRSTDMGKTFTQIKDLDYTLGFLKIDKNNIIYASSMEKGDVVASKDNGDTWDVIFSGLLTTYLCFGNDNDAFLGTYYDGVFKTENLVSVAGDINTNQEEINLLPNPASDYIEINAGDALNGIQQEFRIYSALGECLLDGRSAPFTQKKIDISNLATGLYFLELNGKIYKFIKY